MEKQKINKKIDFAFGKDIYLLGQDIDGINYWLEAPSWDCGWYWGFGYVETYTNNICPSRSRDINTHEHINSSFCGCKGSNGVYIHNIYNCPILAKTTFTENEGWELSELFKAFYITKDYADIKYSGGAGIASSDAVRGLQDKEFHKYLTDSEMVKIMKRILEILTPDGCTPVTIAK